MGKAIQSPKRIIPKLRMTTQIRSIQDRVAIPDDGIGKKSTWSKIKTGIGTTVEAVASTIWLIFSFYLAAILGCDIYARMREKHLSLLVAFFDSATAGRWTHSEDTPTKP